MAGKLKLFLKLNNYGDKRRTGLLVLVFFTQIIFLFVCLFSYSSIKSTSSSVYGSNHFTILLPSESAVSDLNFNLIENKCDNYFVQIDEELIARKNTNSYVKEGRDIRTNGEMLVGSSSDKKINDTVELFDGIFFTVVGKVTVRASEILISDVPEDITVDGFFAVAGNLSSEKSRAEFGSFLEETYSAEVTYPPPITLAELIDNNVYFKIILGILCLSLVTIALTVYYLIGVKKKNYVTYKILGMSSRSLYTCVAIESFIVMAVQLIIAIGAYLTFDYTGNPFVQNAAYGSYYRIGFTEYLVFILIAFSLYVLANLASLAGVRLKKLKEYL